jgi:SAM-dependent methyltransferase
VDSHEVRREWAERTGEYSPEYYAYYGPDETSEAIRETLTRSLGADASVLELGCSAGRHLEHLRAHGFEDLTGVEVNEDARAVMADSYPDLAATGTFHFAPIEDVIGDFADDQFDAVYSVETLQHLHPDFDWVFAELARVTAHLLVTVENEGDADTDARADADAVNYVNDEFPLYYRDWGRVFTDLGFEELNVTPGDRDTLRAFRAP